MLWHFDLLKFSDSIRLFVWQDHDRLLTLNIVITEIFLHSIKCIKPPNAILETFLEFIESVMLGKVIIHKPYFKI